MQDISRKMENLKFEKSDDSLSQQIEYYVNLDFDISLSNVDGVKLKVASLARINREKDLKKYILLKKLRRDTVIAYFRAHNSFPRVR